MPLELAGSVVSGIRVEFENGRAVGIDADQGADALRAAAASDDGASRLGEIALVDGEGRIGPLETMFFDTLIDENAASHIALGNGYDHPVEDAADKKRINESRVHIDFMIGSPELAVDGITTPARVVPVSAQRRLADLTTRYEARAAATSSSRSRSSAASSPRSSSRGSAARLSSPNTRSKSGVVR